MDETVEGFTRIRGSVIGAYRCVICGAWTDMPGLHKSWHRDLGGALDIICAVLEKPDE